MAVEKNGAWGTAIEMPGLRAPNVRGHGGVSSVSCGSAGSCVAGASYADGHHHRPGFVAVERDGRWGTEAEIPGLAALNKGGDACVSSESCASAGNCVAAGSYKGRRCGYRGLVAVERNGRWGKATAVPGLSALNDGAGQAQNRSAARELPAG